MSGKNAIELDGISEELTPVLLTRSNSAIAIKTTTVPEPIQPISTSGNSRMSARQQSRLKQEQAGLESQYNLSIDKLNRLRNAQAIENDPATIFKLEQQIKQAELEIEKLELKLESIEAKLNSSRQDSVGVGSDR